MGFVRKLKVHVLFAADRSQASAGAVPAPSFTRDDVQKREVCVVGVTWFAGFGSSVIVSIAARSVGLVLLCDQVMALVGRLIGRYSPPGRLSKEAQVIVHRICNSTAVLSPSKAPMCSTSVATQQVGPRRSIEALAAAAEADALKISR